MALLTSVATHIHMDGKGFSNVCVTAVYYMAVHTAAILYWAGDKQDQIDVLSIASYVTVIGSILKACFK